jgi:TonB family protein
MIFRGLKTCNTESMVNMKICKMDKFIIAIVIACVAFIFSGCNEEKGLVEISSNSNGSESSQDSSVHDYYNGGYESFGSFFGDQVGSNILAAYKLSRSVKKPSERDIKVKNKNGANRTVSDIKKIIRMRVPGLLHVYEKYLKKSHKFRGKITLKLTIAANGGVTDVSIVSSTTQNREFDAEIQQKMRSWVFHRVESGETTVTMPFTFLDDFCMQTVICKINKNKVIPCFS